MDSLFLLQFACFIFMLINALFVALSHLHVRWENKRYERSRWMIVVALIGLAIQYAVQMVFGFRAADDSLGAIVNILIYTPCFSLISMGIYNTMCSSDNSVLQSVFPSRRQCRFAYDGIIWAPAARAMDGYIGACGADQGAEAPRYMRAYARLTNMNGRKNKSRIEAVPSALLPQYLADKAERRGTFFFT